MVYLDNIIIYSNSEKEYKENMLVIIKKCKFYTKKTDFIRFIIKLKQINMDLKKIKTIVNQQDLKSVIGLKLFLKFCNYYRRFIVNWSSKTEPFTKIIKKDKNQKWDKEQKKLFKEIKNKFIEELILKIYRLELLMKIKIDLLDFILGAYIVQKYKNKIWHPVAYYSKKLTLLELNYNIYDKELLAIVTALKEWRAFL